jgi:hypothetical protein
VTRKQAEQAHSLSMTTIANKIFRSARRKVLAVRFISSIAMLAYLFTFSVTPLGIWVSLAAFIAPTAGITSAALTDTSTLAPPGTVNRTVPPMLAPSPQIKFSAHVTDTEIERAHIFDERLIRIGARPDSQENAALAKVLSSYAEASLAAGPSGKDTVELGSIEQFIISHPNSSWKVALLTNLGIEYYRRCAFTKALDPSSTV